MTPTNEGLVFLVKQTEQFVPDRQDWQVCVNTFHSETGAGDEGSHLFPSSLHGTPARLYTRKKLTFVEFLHLLECLGVLLFGQ